MKRYAVSKNDKENSDRTEPIDRGRYASANWRTFDGIIVVRRTIRIAIGRRTEAVENATAQIQAEIERRQAAVTSANTAVRQLEILKENDRKALEHKLEQVVQGYMDEVAARRARLAKLQSSESDRS